MNYEIPIRFYNVSSDEILTSVKKISEEVCSKAKKIIDKDIYTIPSIAAGKSAESARSLSEEDIKWIYDKFTLKFLYWKEYNLLGLVGAAANELDDTDGSKTVVFQNTSSHDYNLTSYPELPFFVLLEHEVRKLTVAELRKMSGDEDGNEDDFIDTYVRNTFMYDKVEEELTIQALVNDGDSTYDDIDINALNSYEKYKEVRELVYGYIYREALRRKLK